MKRLMLLGLLLSAGCASPGKTGDPGREIAVKAGYGLNCPASRIKVTKLRSEKYLAQGCGKKAFYKLHCSLGPCSAVPVGQ